jgi:hypothetical protein
MQASSPALVAFTFEEVVCLVGFFKIEGKILEGFLQEPRRQTGGDGVGWWHPPSEKNVSCLIPLEISPHRSLAAPPFS